VISPSSSIQPSRDQLTIIQQEGWLLKRGAGFKNGTDSGSGPLGSATSSTEEETPVRRTSGLRLPTAPSAVTSLLFGKDEKRRYFMLLTTPAASGRKLSKDAKQGPQAELRYFKKRPETELERANPKGSIVLTADMDVSLDDNIILVYAPNRTYYLRQDIPEQQSAKARTLASQWINAIRFALNGLRAYELQGAVGAGGAPHPLQDRRSIRISALTGLNEERKAARKSFSNKGANGLGGIAEDNSDGMATDVCAFADLWHIEGIEAYDKVVAHFGPALKDLSRLQDHFASRLAQLEGELAILETELGHAGDVVVKEQRTIADAMRELHRSSQRHQSALKEAMKDLKTRVIAPIEDAIKEISARLESIVNRHSAAAAYVEGAKKALLEAMEKVDRLQEALEAACLAMSEPSSQRSANQRMLRRKSDAPLPDPAKVENDLNEARQQRRDASQILVTTETKHAESISRAMDELFKLEQLRLGRIVTILEAGTDIEYRLTQRLVDDSASVETPLENIDAAKDIRATFARLKASAEKNREKPRRKNSLFNRLDFAKLTGDVEQ
jgi:hypothetical protein